MNGNLYVNRKWWNGNI